MYLFLFVYLYKQRQMEITTFKQLRRYFNTINDENFTIKFTEVGYKNPKIRMDISFPGEIHENWFEPLISKNGKVLYMSDSEYYTEKELVIRIKNYIDFLRNPLADRN